MLAAALVGLAPTACSGSGDSTRPGEETTTTGVIAAARNRAGGVVDAVNAQQEEIEEATSAE